MNGNYITLLGLLVIALGSWLSIYGQMIVRKADTEKSRTLLDTQLNRMEGKLGSDDATQRYLDAVGQLSRQLAGQKSGNAAAKYFSSESERKKLRNEIHEANQKVVAGEKIRIQPVADYLLAKVDGWLEEARKHGIKVDIKRANLPVVNVGETITGSVREIRFENGKWLRVILYAELIVDGRVTEPFGCNLVLLTKDGSQVGAGQAIRVDIDDKHYSVRNFAPAKFAYKPYEGTGSNPIEDRQLVETLDEAFDEFMAFCLEQASSEK
jgi:hypothetical protein